MSSVVDVVKFSKTRGGVIHLSIHAMGRYGGSIMVNDVAIYSVLPDFDEVDHVITFLDFDKEGKITNYQIAFRCSFFSVFYYDIIQGNGSDENHE